MGPFCVATPPLPEMSRKRKRNELPTQSRWKAPGGRGTLSWRQSSLDHQPLGLSSTQRRPASWPKSSEFFRKCVGLIQASPQCGVWCFGRDRLFSPPPLVPAVEHLGATLDPMASPSEGRLFRWQGLSFSHGESSFFWPLGPRMPKSVGTMAAPPVGFQGL